MSKSKNKTNDQCSICSKNVRENSKAIQCDICDLWVHASCEWISKERYNQLSEPDNEEVFFCSNCLNNELPFGFENNKVFQQTNSLGLNNESSLENLQFNLSKHDKKAINYISKMILENNDPNSNNGNFCNYYSIDDLNFHNF